MKPKDLKNSNDELKATSENSGAADTPELNLETTPAKTSEKVEEPTKEEKPAVEEVVEDEINEDQPVEVEEVVAEAKPEVAQEEAVLPDESQVSGEEVVAEPVVETEEVVEAEATEPIGEVIEDEISKNQSVKAEEVVSEAKPEAVQEEAALPDELQVSEEEVVAEPVVEIEKVAEAETTEPEVVAKKEAGDSVDEKVIEEAKEETKATADENTEVKTEKPVVEADAVKQEVAVEESTAVKAQRETIDYTVLNEVELINVLRDLLSKHADDDIKADIDSIKVNFYKKHHAIVEEEKKKYLEDGGEEEGFEASNVLYEEDLRNLLKDYRRLKNKQHKELEDEKDDNLQRKYEIIDEIKNLVNRKESINKTFHEFRDLQQEWREIGLVPQSKLKDLWETYHHHVENFYDYIKINRELRDLDLKKNLEAKIILCEKAEELLVEPAVIKAFNILQKFHEQWREIGPVPRDKKEELWERFKAATSKINKKHQGYFENRKLDQKKNLDAKTALCEKAEEIANREIENHRDWDQMSRELIELQKVWRTIGFAPKKDNNLIYERFRGACDKFFDTKRDFYSQNKELQQNNLQMKTDLCVQAESLKDSTDWKKTTEEFIRIQKKWKDVGPVPRKHSDIVWKRFRVACDYFFENKSKHFHHVDEEQVDNLKLKKELIEEVKNYKLTKDEDADLEQIKNFQRRWTDVGHVPFRDKDIIQNEFRDVINNHFDSLKIDDHKRNLLKFRTKIANISGTTRGGNKMRYERDKYASRLKQMESDLILLNNNIGFFANTKNAESLIEDVNKKIQDTQEKIKFLKEKIKIIDAMDDED